jgi:hypothetical protein
MGAMLWLNQALPYRGRVAFARLSNADAVMSRIDAGERAAYDERVKEGAKS